MMVSTLKILLVEDEPMWQEGIRALLESSGEANLSHVAEDYEGALVAYAQTMPDVVLLDWNIKGARDGLAVGQALTEQGFPPERIILVSGTDPSAVPANPYHFVPKQRIASSLLDTIRRVTEN